MELIKLYNFVSTLESKIYFILICVSSGCLSPNYRKSLCYYFDRHPDQVYIPSQLDFKHGSFYSDSCQ